MSISLLDKAVLLICYTLPCNTTNSNMDRWKIPIDNLKREGYIRTNPDGDIKTTDKATPICTAIHEVPEPIWTMPPREVPK